MSKTSAGKNEQLMETIPWKFANSEYVYRVQKAIVSSVTYMERKIAFDVKQPVEDHDVKGSI